MNPTSPTSPAVCSTCSTPLPPGTDRCARCGTLHGEHRRCADCGAKAEVSLQGGGVFVCAACGRPRVPMERGGIPRTGGEREALARVAEARSDVILARIASVAGGVIGGLVWLVAVISYLAGFGMLSLVVSLVGMAVVAAVVLAFMAASRAQRRAADAMQNALGQVALEIMQAQGPITARALGQQMGIAENLADRVLARLPTRTDVRVETVLDERATDGQVRYRIADPLLPANVKALEQAQNIEQAAFDERLRQAMQHKRQP